MNSNNCILENENDGSFINSETLKKHLNNLRYNKNPRVIYLIYRICQKLNLNFRVNIEYFNTGYSRRIGNSFYEELMSFYWNPERHSKWFEDIFIDSYIV